MFFRKKKSESNPLFTNARRKFHHLLLSRKKPHLSSQLSRERPTVNSLRRRRFWNSSHSPRMTFFRKVSFIFLGVLIFIGLTYLLFVSSLFNVSKITIEKSGNVVSVATLSPYFDKLRGKNIFFVNTENLTKEVQQTFKNEIREVRIRKTSPQHIVVDVEEYPAVVNLKITTPEKNQVFVLNEIGYAFSENKEQKELPSMLVNLQKPLTGKTFLIDQERLTTIMTAYKKFTELFGMKVTEVYWKKVERELHLKTEKQFMVWLDLTGDTEQQLLKLKRAIAKLDIYHVPLEYIDLRIAGGDSEKVIFKRRK